MAAQVMTFDQFRATGRDSDDMARELGYTNEDEHGNHMPMPGRIYLGSLYIERGGDGEYSLPADPNDSTRGWCLTIGNDSRKSRDLASLERELYEFACAEGYCERDLRDATPCGLNADWVNQCWFFGGDTARDGASGVYVFDEDDNTFSVLRVDGFDADEQKVIVELARFPHWDAAADAARAIVAGGAA